MKKIIFIIVLLLISKSSYAGDFSTWHEYVSNPVFTATQLWEGGTYIADGSMVLKGDTYYRFYCAGGTGLYGSDQQKLGYAISTTSQFPFTWTKYANNPILAPADAVPGIDPASTAAICAARVSHRPDGSWRMLVHVYNSENNTARGYVFTTSDANFPLGWTIANGGNPVISELAGTFYSVMIQVQNEFPPEQSNDGKWHLFFVGWDGATYSGGHATATDAAGLNYVVQGQVMAPSGSGWYSQHLIPVGTGIKIGNTFYITVQGYGSPTISGCIDGTYNPNGYVWRLGYYSTTDLNNIGTIHADPIIQPSGVNGSWNKCGTEGAELIQESNGIVDILYLAENQAYNPSGGLNYTAGISRNFTFIPKISSFGNGGAISGFGNGGKISFP